MVSNTETDLVTDRLLNNVESAFTRTETTREVILGDVSTIPLDDTTGWGALETELGLLHKIILSTSNKHLLESYESRVWILSISKGSVHVSRHIRQAVHLFSNELITKFFVSEPSVSTLLDQSKPTTIQTNILLLIYNSLCEGLQDNWSEIRMVACTSARTFLSAIPDTQQHMYWEGLLPRLCLNRFYSGASSVQAYSLETWRIAIRDRGKSLLRQYMRDTVAHYIVMSKAKNHTVSEAACDAMAELISKIDKEIVKPYVPQMLEALYGCLNETSWPVRDAACVATGTCLKYYPELQEVTKLKDSIFSIWTSQLQDDIWSVRENAAVSFAEASACNRRQIQYQNLGFIRNYISDNIFKAREEKSLETKYKISSFLPPELIVQARKVQLDEHESSVEAKSINSTRSYKLTNNQSTNSLETASVEASKSTRMWRAGGGWGCCLDCLTERTRALWATSAGCVVLVRELSRVAVETHGTECQYSQQVSTAPQGSGIARNDPKSHQVSQLSLGSTKLCSLSPRATVGCAEYSESSMEGPINLTNTMEGDYDALSIVQDNLPSIWELLKINHFKDHEKLHVIVLQHLPDIYKNLRHLSHGMDPMLTQQQWDLVNSFRQSNHAGTKMAAQDFASFVNTYNKHPC